MHVRKSTRYSLYNLTHGGEKLSSKEDKKRFEVTHCLVVCWLLACRPILLVQVAALRRKNRHQPSTSSVSSSTVAPKGPSDLRTPSVSVLSSSTSDTSYSATLVLRQQERGSNGLHDRHLKRRMSSVFSSDSAKRKWRNFERRVSLVYI